MKNSVFVVSCTDYDTYDHAIDNRYVAAVFDDYFSAVDFANIELNRLFAQVSEDKDSNVQLFPERIDNHVWVRSISIDHSGLRTYGTEVAYEVEEFKVLKRKEN